MRGRVLTGQGRGEGSHARGHRADRRGGRRGRPVERRVSHTPSARRKNSLARDSRHPGRSFGRPGSRGFHGATRRKRSTTSSRAGGGGPAMEDGDATLTFKFRETPRGLVVEAWARSLSGLSFREKPQRDAFSTAVGCCPWATTGLPARCPGSWRSGHRRARREARSGSQRDRSRATVASLR